MYRGKKQWRTKLEAVDVETGEIITKSQAEREYIIKKKIIKRKNNEHEDNERYNIISITWECERNRQQSIWGN